MKKNKLLLIINLFLMLFFIPLPANADPLTISLLFSFAVHAIIVSAPGLIISGLLSTGITALCGGFSSNSKGNSSSSPTYKFGALQTTSNNSYAIPIIYGKVKVAGNLVWQTNPENPTLRRIIAYADGPISGFSDVRLNDNAINKLSGCSYTAYTGTATQAIDSRVTGKTQEDKAKLVGGLRNTAYLAITATASQKVNGNFTSTTMVKGSLLRIYTTLTHFTDGNYSNNPAWCILDFLTRYNGCGLDYSDIDIQSFIDAANYCDVLISNEMTGTVSTKAKAVTGTDTKFKTEISLDDTICLNGINKIVTSITDDTHLTVDTAYETLTNQTAIQKQPRFTLNFILDERKSRLDWINEMALTCCGYLVYQQGKLVLNIDKPDIVLQVFDKDNIIAGSETFSTSARENRYDIVKVHYPSPVDEYALIYAQAEADEFQNEQPIVKEVEIYGVTNFRQGSRLARFYLNQSITCKQAITFKTTKVGLDRVVGDLIAVTSTFAGFTEKKYRITQMSEAQEGQIEITAVEYNENLYTDQQGSVAPVINYVTIADAYQIPEDVSNFSVVQNTNLLEFNWILPVGADFCEIRQGDSWESGKIIGENLTDTSYIVTLLSPGTFRYWIKAKTQYNDCINALSDSINVQYIPNMNEIINFNVLQNTVGIFDNTYIQKNRLYLNSAKKWVDKTPTKWSKNAIDGDYSTGTKWTYLTVPTGIYYSDLFDIGSILDNYIDYVFEFNRQDSEATCSLEYSTSTDKVNFTEWKLISKGQATFEYIKFRITINNPNQKPVNLSNFIVSIKAPNREENYTNRTITNAADGVTIIYATDIESKQAKPFASPEPHVMATPKTNSSSATVSSTPTSCTIKLYNNATGALIAGAVNVTVKGY